MLQLDPRKMALLNSGREGDYKKERDNAMEVRRQINKLKSTFSED